MSLSRHKVAMVTAETALAGHPDYTFAVPDTHYVNGHRIRQPFEQDGLEIAVFGLGCFWGAERLFWQTPGVWSTAVGYSGGFSTFPTYDEVCSGRTGHTEAVLVAFDPSVVSYAQLLQVLFEGHDPTQGMRQGNDVGTQYRSAIYFSSPEQGAQARAAADAFSKRLASAGFSAVTTEIAPLGAFYYAEGYHQQYLAKNPNGYCGLGGTGVACPVGLFTPEAG